MTHNRVLIAANEQVKRESNAVAVTESLLQICQELASSAFSASYQIFHTFPCIFYAMVDCPMLVSLKGLICGDFPRSIVQ